MWRIWCKKIYRKEYSFHIVNLLPNPRCPPSFAVSACLSLWSVLLVIYQDTHICTGRKSTKKQVTNQKKKIKMCHKVVVVQLVATHWDVNHLLSDSKPFLQQGTVSWHWTVPKTSGAVLTIERPWEGHLGSVNSQNKTCFRICPVIGVWQMHYLPDARLSLNEKVSSNLIILPVLNDQWTQTGGWGHLHLE